MKLAYNGQNYHGWQIQDNAHTIQAEITSKLSTILGVNVPLTGCGRTDTGVHAREFYAHFDIKNSLNESVNLVHKLNSFLPYDIVIKDISQVSNDFNARFDAKSRTYSYYITTIKNPFKENTTYYYNGRLNLDEMNKASAFLLKHTDFTSFSKLHTQTATNNCKIYFANFERVGDEIIFTIKADRFLRNMVRAIVGTLLEVGKGKLMASDVNSIIEAKSRQQAGFSVPAKGLFLEKVEY